jgi:WD40 repeat protein
VFLERWKENVGVQQATGRLVAFSKDGMYVAIATRNRVELRDSWGKNLLLPAFTHHATVDYLAFDAQSTRLAAASRDGSVSLWDINRRGSIPIDASRRFETVHCLAFGPGGLLALAGPDGSVIVWDTVGNQENARFNTLGEVVRCLTFSPDGKYLVAGCQDWTVRIFETWSWRALEWRPGHSSPVTHVAFSPDGSRLITASEDQMVKFWDTAKEWNFAGKLDNKSAVMDFSISPDGSRLVTTGQDGKLRLWDISDISDLANNSAGQPLVTLRRTDAPVRFASFNPAREYPVLAVICDDRFPSISGDKIVEFWTARMQP